MKGGTDSAAPWLGLATLWTAAFVLSCGLSTVESTADAGEHASIAAAVFGEARHAISGQFYELADQHFHCGVPHLSERAFERGFFQRLQRAAAPEEHRHLEGDNIKEMFPWLWMTLSMDPQNVESFRVTAFWLATAAGRADEAHRVLIQAQQNNPYNYQIKLDRGRLYLRQNQLKEAAACFDAALRFVPRTAGVDPELVRIETAEIMTHRALLHETTGHTRNALALYDAVLHLFPERVSLRDRVGAIRKGEEPKPKAQDLLRAMLRKQEEHDCGRDHADSEESHECKEHDHTHCSHETPHA